MPTTQVSLPIEFVEQLFKKNHKVRTVADLLAIPLEPSSRIIRVVPDMYESTWTIDQLDWKKAWTLCSYIRATTAVKYHYYYPELKNWFDRLRFAVHVKLIKWRVIV